MGGNGSNRVTHDEVAEERPVKVRRLTFGTVETMQTLHEKAYTFFFPCLPHSRWTILVFLLPREP